MYLYCPFNKECNGRDPVESLIMSWGRGAADEKCFVPYTGPLPDSDEYKAEVAKFDGCLKNERLAASTRQASKEKT